MPVLVERPTGAYTSTTTQTNATKYQTDSSLQEAIGSGKVDGDVNKLVDAINTIYSYDANGAFTNLELAVEQIKQNADDIANIVSVSIPDGSITAAKLASNSVTNSKIADNSITSTKISDLEVGTSDIVDGAITAPKIGAGAVTNAKVANNTINEAQIQNLSVTENKIGAGAVTVGKISSSGATSGQVLTSNGGGGASFSSLPPASETVAGIVEKATDLEVQTRATTGDTGANLVMTPEQLSEFWVRSSSESMSGNANVDWTGIPSWATQIEILTIAASTSGTTNLTCLIGDSGGFETSGYVGWSTAGSGHSTYFNIGNAVTSGQSLTVRTKLIKQVGNNWMLESALTNNSGNFWALGYKSLSGTLDRIRIGVSSGTFDAGTTMIRYS